MKHAKKSRQFSGAVRELDARKDSQQVQDLSDVDLERYYGTKKGLEAAIKKLEKQMPDYKIPKPKYNLPRSKRC